MALLHLDRPVFYQANVIPICLPPRDIPLTGKIGMVAGWGKTDNKDQTMRPRMSEDLPNDCLALSCIVY